MKSIHRLTEAPQPIKPSTLAKHLLQSRPVTDFLIFMVFVAGVVVGKLA